MPVSVSIEPTQISVEPGGQATCVVTVRNTGSVVDAYTVSVVGPAAPWAVIEPTEVRLYPGTEDTARVTFGPPAGADAAAGEMPFGVRVVPSEDPGGSSVEEGVLVVAAAALLGAEIVPRTSNGPRRGRHQLAITNAGNAPLHVELSGSDADDLLIYAFSPAALDIAPGAAALAEVAAKPRKRFLRGPGRTRPFTVTASSDRAAPVSVEATMLQTAVIPRWLAIVGSCLLAVLLLLLVLWFAYLQPKIRSEAKEAAKKENAATQEQLKQQDANIADLSKKIGASPPPPVATPATAPPASGAAGAPGDYAALGPPFALTLSATGGNQNPSFTVPAGKTFSLTDIVLQNPQGDAGLLRIRRGGAVLLTVRLENFRDTDYHFVSPIVFGAGNQLVLSVQCGNPPGSPCTPSGFFTGFLRG